MDAGRGGGWRRGRAQRAAIAHGRADCEGLIESTQGGGPFAGPSRLDDVEVAPSHVQVLPEEACGRVEL